MVVIFVRFIWFTLYDISDYAKCIMAMTFVSSHEVVSIVNWYDDKLSQPTRAYRKRYFMRRDTRPTKDIINGCVFRNWSAFALHSQLRIYASSSKTKSPRSEIVETWTEIVITETKVCRVRDCLTNHRRGWGWEWMW